MHRKQHMFDAMQNIDEAAKQVVAQMHCPKTLLLLPCRYFSGNGSEIAALHPPRCAPRWNAGEVRSLNTQHNPIRGRRRCERGMEEFNTFWTWTSLGPFKDTQFKLNDWMIKQNKGWILCDRNCEWNEAVVRHKSHDFHTKIRNTRVCVFSHSISHVTLCHVF